MKTSRSSFLRSITGNNNFYHLAFTLAQSDTDIEKIRFSPKDHVSQFLESCTQKALFISSAEKKTSTTLKESTSIHINPKDISPLDLHKKVAAFNEDSSNKPVILQNHKKELPVEEIKLFSSYRLRNKSRQQYTGINQNIKYFHAHFKCQKRKFDLVYWIKFNGQNNPVAGEFVNV